MFGWIKSVTDAVRRGNEYRREVHGTTEGFAESYHNARAMTKEYRAQLQRSTQNAAEKDSILIHAAVWERWTGGRFEKVDNPIHKMTEQEFRSSVWGRGLIAKPKNKGYTARSNPVTGDYELV